MSDKINTYQGEYDHATYESHGIKVASGSVMSHQYIECKGCNVLYPKEANHNCFNEESKDMRVHVVATMLSNLYNGSYIHDQTIKDAFELVDRIMSFHEKNPR